MDDPKHDIPDFFKELSAWRKFSSHAGGTVLASVNGVAHPLRDMGASYCTNQLAVVDRVYRIATDTMEARVRSHACPSLDCTCGFYCYKTREDAQQHSQGEILARVSVWGRIAEHTRGYRAERMRIEELFLPTHMAHFLESLEKRYGVPVTVDKESGSWISDSQSASSSSNHYQSLLALGLAQSYIPFQSQQLPPSQISHQLGCPCPTCNPQSWQNKGLQNSALSVQSAQRLLGLQNQYHGAYNRFIAAQLQAPRPIAYVPRFDAIYGVATIAPPLVVVEDAPQPPVSPTEHADPESFDPVADRVNKRLRATQQNRVAS